MLARCANWMPIEVDTEKPNCNPANPVAAIISLLTFPLWPCSVECPALRRQRSFFACIRICHGVCSWPPAILVPVMLPHTRLFNFLGCMNQASKGKSFGKHLQAAQELQGWVHRAALTLLVTFSRLSLRDKNSKFTFSPNPVYIDERCEAGFGSPVTIVSSEATQEEEEPVKPWSIPAVVDEGEPSWKISCGRCIERIKGIGMRKEE